MKKSIFTLWVVLLLMSISLSAAENVNPVTFNLWEGVQGPGGPESSVKGVRFNFVYGVNENLTGFDFGLILPVNIIKNEMKGFQLGLYNSVKKGKGVQWGVVNYSKSEFVGWQNGAVNVSEGKIEGVQTAFVNVAENFNGLQLGVINYTKTLKGLQIGVININTQGTATKYPFLVLPIVNFNFK